MSKVKIKELDRVALTSNKDNGLQKGDVGTVVMVHYEGEGYEVEFIDFVGNTISIETCTPAEIRLLKQNEIPTVRSYLSA